MKITIGTDPEFFLFDLDQKMYVSAHDIVPGTKKEPFKLNRGALQSDGLAVEFNIDPASTAYEFDRNIRVVLKQIRKMIPSKYVFSFTPYVLFNPSYFNSLPASAKELGCDPDFTAKKMHPKPNLQNLLGPRRTAAGHIHIGWGSGFDTSPNSEHFVDCETIARNLLAIDADIDPRETSRKVYYGGGGAFRPKPYGIEYRGFSNHWVRYPATRIEMFNSVKRVFDATLQGKALKPRDYRNYTSLGELHNLNECVL